MEGIITLLIIFFIPVLFTLIDFVFFLAKGEKAFDHFGGLILDGLHLLVFPLLFMLFFSYAGGRSIFIFHEPYIAVSIPLIVLSVIGYYIVSYAYPLISNSWTVIILILLACGIFINVSMIIDQPSILSFFNIPIILLYIIQIGLNVKRLL